MNLIRKLISTTRRTVAFVCWWGLALWTALAIFFTLPVPSWLATVLALAVFGLYLSANRESVRWFTWPKTPWNDKHRSTAALVISVLFATWYFVFVVPDPNQEWAFEQARQPVVTI